MQTYATLIQQANALFAQAEQLRQKEREQAIVEIRETMRTFGLTAKELGLVSKTPKVAPSSRAPRYVGPNGEEWIGRGLHPAWVKELVASGKDLQQFRVRP